LYSTSISKTPEATCFYAIIWDMVLSWSMSAVHAASHTKHACNSAVYQYTVYRVIINLFSENVSDDKIDKKIISKFCTKL